jgi:hypothetical protein
MLIDCDTCSVRGHGCADCVVTVLLGAPPAGVELDATEQAAISVLADHGLVPPLRLAHSGPAHSGAASPGPGHSERADTANARLRLGCVKATG